jgi:8-oxo-dGTP pyrophosphatase MutT (NUDIX family)
MEWKVVSERPLYADEWLDIRIADVELPDGRHLAHRSIRTPPGAGAVVIDTGRRVLLIWRHRFITGTWSWEIPVGKIEDGETPAGAAAREFEEETGWQPCSTSSARHERFASVPCWRSHGVACQARRLAYNRLIPSIMQSRSS